MVPPRDQIKVSEPFVVGVGAIGFNGNGEWKIHISINPAQMEEAIPIILEVLHGPNAPRLGFKMQTKANLDSTHQIGKEFAIIFDRKVEKAALNGKLDIVEACLSLLWNKLVEAGIFPEPGFILTPETMEKIEKMPEKSQGLEKDNLLTGRFDRAIPCPNNCNFFHYRDGLAVLVQDADFKALEGFPGIFQASEIVRLAKEEPEFAHNPGKKADPFLQLKIKAS